MAALLGPFEGFLELDTVVEVTVGTVPEFPAMAEPEGTRCGPPGTETWLEGTRFEVTAGTGGTVGAGVDFDDEGGWTKDMRLASPRRRGA